MFSKVELMTIRLELKILSSVIFPCVLSLEFFCGPLAERGSPIQSLVCLHIVLTNQ